MPLQPYTVINIQLSSLHSAQFRALVALSTPQLRTAAVSYTPSHPSVDKHLSYSLRRTPSYAACLFLEHNIAAPVERLPTSGSCMRLVRHMYPFSAYPLICMATFLLLQPFEGQAFFLQVNLPMT
jgi:hypothetical protein